MRFGAFFLALVVASAQPASSPGKTVAGEITAVDTSAKHLTVKGDDGAIYTIAPEDAASIRRVPLGETDVKKATKIAFADIVAGDRLLTRGSLSDDKTMSVKTILIMSKADVAKKQDDDRTEWQRRGIAGTVTAVDPVAKEVTISTHGRNAKTVIIEAAASGFRRYAADSVSFSDAKPSTLADLQPGDTLRALGDKNEDGTRFKAQQMVFGTFETIAATVLSVDPASGEVTVTNLQTKKPVVVKTTSNSTMHRLPEGTAKMLALRYRPDLAGANGRGPGGGPGAGRQGAPGAAADTPSGSSGAGRSGAGRGMTINGDLSQILDGSPKLSLAELKKGDALIVYSAKGAAGTPLMAISVVAGVEAFLAAAPRSNGQVNLGAWNLDMGMPEQ